MPIYEYTCEKCGTRFDHLARSMSARDEKVACPKCQSAKTSRQLSTFAVAAAEAKSTVPAGCAGECGREPGSCCMNM